MVFRSTGKNKPVYEECALYCKGFIFSTLPTLVVGKIYITCVCGVYIFEHVIISLLALLEQSSGRAIEVLMCLSVYQFVKSFDWISPLESLDQLLRHLI